MRNRMITRGAVCVMLAGLLLGAYKYSIAVGITAAVCGIAAIILNSRCKIDESATMMQIPIHHIDSSMTGSYAVCYLPDGKYRIPVSRKFPFEPGSVTVVTCGKITLLDFNKKEIRKETHHERAQVQI